MRSDGVVWKQGVEELEAQAQAPLRACGAGCGAASVRAAGVTTVSLHLSAALLFTLPDARPLNTTAFSEHARARLLHPVAPALVEEVVDGRRGGEDEGRHGLCGASASVKFDGGLDLRLAGVPGLPIRFGPVAVGVDCVDGVLHARRARALRRATQSTTPRRRG